MNRRSLERAILEVGRRMDLDYFYVIGSAAVFASVPNADDPAFTGTRDVDVIPSPPEPSDVEILANRIDFVLGEGSDFDINNGYYVQGVDMSTPRFAPRGWKERAIPVRVEGITGLCMELHDLVLSKYCVGREKDLAFTRALAQTGRIEKRVLMERLPEIDMDAGLRKLVQARISADMG